MKFLEDANLAKLTHELTDVICGTRIINGRIEAYTCKRAGTDKKYAHVLAERYTHEVESQDIPFENSPYANSPLGDFHESSVRRLMTDLILTLNATFLDYDFGNVRPSHFRRLAPAKTAINIANKRLSEVAQQKPAGFLNDMWKKIDEVIVLADCEVYSFQPEEEGDESADPFATHTPPVSNGLLGASDEHEVGALLWSFNFFFVNKHMKRILFFTCMQSCLKEDCSDSDDADYQVMSSLNAKDDPASGSFDAEDDDGYSGFVMDVDIVDEPAVSIATA